MEDKSGCLLWGAVVVVVLLVVSLCMSFYQVPAGSVGVVTTWGAVTRTVDPGLGMKWPIAQSVHKMSIQVQKDQVDCSAASQDLQLVTSKIAVNYHLDALKALYIYQTIGLGYQDTVISPAIQNAFKAITAHYTAEQLITKRDEVRSKAEEELVSVLAKYNIVIDGVNIVNFDFSPEFNAAIEAKQVAQQQVETAKQTLAKSVVEAQQQVAVAQGQADAQKALKDTGSLTPEYLEFVFLNKWNGVLPLSMGGNPLTMFLNTSTNTATPATTK